MSADDSSHRVTEEFQENMDMFDWTISDADMSTLDAIGPARPVRTRLPSPSMQSACTLIGYVCTGAAIP